jgi:hypothetical protein
MLNASTDSVAEIEERISVLRENLRQLIEQGAAYSGAADDQLSSHRISEQEVELELLTKRRDELMASATKSAAKSAPRS